MMKIGLVMNTYNFADKLQLCLESILDQTERPDLIYVTNDGSSDGTRDVLDGWARDVSGTNIVHNPESKFDMVRAADFHKAGINWCFEQGCDYAVLIGDDIIMSPGFIEGITDRMCRDNALYACGRIESEPGGFVDGVSAVDFGHWAECYHNIYIPYFRHSVLYWSAVMRSACRIYPDVLAHTMRPRGTCYDADIWAWRGRANRYVGNTWPWAMCKAARTWRTWGMWAARAFVGGFAEWNNEPGAMDGIRKYVKSNQFRSTESVISKPW